MANKVTVQMIGGQPKILDGVNTIQDVMTKLDLSNVTTKVNGDTQEPSYELSDYDFISIGEKVKGGAQ